MAAGAERFVNDNNQMESAWPVYGVTEFEGKIWAAANAMLKLIGYLFGDWIQKPDPLLAE